MRSALAISQWFWNQPCSAQSWRKDSWELALVHLVKVDWLYCQGAFALSGAVRCTKCWLGTVFAGVGVVFMMFLLLIFRSVSKMMANGVCIVSRICLVRLLCVYFIEGLCCVYLCSSQLRCSKYGPQNRHAAQSCALVVLNQPKVDGNRQSLRGLLSNICVSIAGISCWKPIHHPTQLATCLAAL